MTTFQPDSGEVEAITGWSRDFITQIAPQELPLFRAASDIYFKDPARFGKTPTGSADKMIGFGSAEIVDLVTPIVLIVVGEVVRFAVRELGVALKSRKPDGVAPLNAARDLQPAEWVRMRDLLIEHFSLSEMQDLCFEIGIDYELLAGAGKHDKARELLDYCRRHGRMASLMAACRKARPFAVWSQTENATLTAEQLAQVYDLALRRARELSLSEQQAELLAGGLMDGLARSIA